MSTASAIGMRTAGLLLVVASILAGCRARERSACVTRGHAPEHGSLRVGTRAPEPVEPLPITPPVRSEVPARDASAADDPEKAAHERIRARRALRKEIEALDEDLVALVDEARRAKPALRGDTLVDVRTARAWRDRLAGDLQAVDRAGDLVWDALREQIDHDLAEVRPREEPPCEGDACRAFDL